MELTARIHIEDGGHWADVPGLPGCFASGDTLDEHGRGRQLHAATAPLTDSPLATA